MIEKPLLLVVDDDDNICQLIKLYMEKEGFAVETVQRGDDGVAAFHKIRPNMVILDVMLPGMEGWEVLREIRKVDRTPVIMLTAKGETFDKVLGLELGADDYMTKPFDPKELIARIKAVIRRTQPAPETNDKELRFEGLTISLANYTVNYRGETMELPPKEIELLYFLAGHPNKVFTREQLLEQVWDFDYYGDSRTVDVHIKRLREKLSDEGNPWQLKTVWGVGYKFEVK